MTHQHHHRSVRRARLAIGGAASAGLLALVLGLGLPALPERSQRLLCAALRGICSVIAPETDCAPMPHRPLDGQATPAASGCPTAYAAHNGGCWLAAEAKPPCPVLTYEKDGRCFTPLMMPGRKIPNATEQEP